MRAQRRRSRRALVLRGLLHSNLPGCRGLHLLAPGAGAAGHRLVSCSAGGVLRVHSQDGGGAAWGTVASWKAGGAGKLAAGAACVGGGRWAAGGDGLDVSVYDVSTGAVLFAAKPPPKDWLGMYVKVRVASLVWLGASAPELLLAGGEKEVRLFDLRAQRRAVRTWAVGEGVVNALAVAPSGAALAAGDTHGRCALYDLPSGRLTGVLKGCAGSVRSLAWHPSGSHVAATGLDRFVRIFCARTRGGFKASLFVKQPCTAVAFDWRTVALMEAADTAAATAPAEEAPAPVAARKKHKRTSAVMDALAEAAQKPKKLGVPKRTKQRDAGMLLHLEA